MSPQVSPETAAALRRVTVDDIRDWYSTASSLEVFTRSLGQHQVSAEHLENTIGLPLHLRVVIQGLSAETDGPVPATVLDSIPFYSLCKGLFLPLSALHPDKVAHLFGIKADPPPDTAGRQELLAEFIKKEIGLSLEQKLACILGDPFLGNPSSFRRDSLMRLLQSLILTSRRALLDRLTQVGEVAALYAEREKELRKDPPLTALEVLETLRFFPPLKRSFKFDVLRSLFARCGKLEAFFIAQLILRKAAFGFDYEGALIARILSDHFKAPAEQISHAIALTDAFKVARVLATEGAEGLRKIQLQPLVPVKPALASGTTDEIKKFPVWVERKYDGIRLMLHKSTDERGSILCGAYTRGRRDWLELVPGLDMTLKTVPALHAIIDGELYGTVVDLEGARPASVYEVYAVMQGEKGVPVNMKYAAFDLLYLNGQDFTRLPLAERRKRLGVLLAPLAAMSLPIPLTVVEGQLAKTKDDVNRLYQHFRAQGYEGVITKDLDGPYLLASRDPTWSKRKPVITLDLALLGAVLAVTTKERAGVFGSYVIGAKLPDGSFADVGDVAGVDRVRDMQIQQVIMREGLITGQRIERQSSSGVRPGFALRPHIVVTVKFEGIAKDFTTGVLSLRDPKLVAIRADKNAFETDSTADIEELYLRQRVG
jgi:DNA ligase-1